MKGFRSREGRFSLKFDERTAHGEGEIAGIGGMAIMASDRVDDLLNSALAAYRSTEPRDGLEERVLAHVRADRFEVFGMKEIGDRIGVTFSGQVSSVAAPVQNLTLPVTREPRMNANVLISVKKPNTVFTADEPFSKGQLQIELTATLMN